jgi:flagellar biosynthetic protein FliR
MSEIINRLILNADYFLLLLCRTGGLFFPSPIFGRSNIPAIAKICFIIALTLMFFLIRAPTEVVDYGALAEFFFKCLCELVFGVILAFISNLFFSLVSFTAGQLMDMQMGFGIVNVYDPQNNTQIPMIGNILNLLLLITFFGVNGHLKLVEIIYITLEKFPVGNISISYETGMAALEIFALAFTLGVMVAMPVIAAGIILELAIGVLIRTVPQMNMFVVGIPVKIFIGLLVLAATMPMFINFSDTIFSEMFAGVEKMFSNFNVGA